MDKNSTFDQIMTEITSKLTGDPKVDVKYLMDQGEVYKNHNYSKEITRAIGRIIFEIVPDEIRDEFNKVVNNNNLGIENVLEEADFQLYRNNCDKALKITETLIKRIEEMNCFDDDAVSEYHSFNNFFEEIVYKKIFNPSKEIRRIPENYAGAYLKYGVVLFELKKYDEAKIALEKANKYNPINIDILFELSEIYKMNKNWDKYLEINKKCLEFAYNSIALARCYRNFGFYYIEMGKYEIAIALLFLSIHFDQNAKIAQSELLYISQKTGKSIKEPDVNEIEKIVENIGIKLGANEIIISVAISFAFEALNNNNNEVAKHFFKISYDLTKDEKIKEIIDKI
jgi:tetratricopeptide (TPR) repeat protein